MRVTPGGFQRPALLPAKRCSKVRLKTTQPPFSTRKAWPMYSTAGVELKAAIRVALSEFGSGSAFSILFDVLKLCLCECETVVEDEINRQSHPSGAGLLF